MHTEIIQDNPGNCPTCGMNLVPVNSKAGEEHSHHHPPEVDKIKPCVK